ncbi:MAG: ATP-binding protein, partial [Anaerolineae bacterium]|nr:ATP-binding protein [Anaerolineae bacterium]
MLIAMAGLPGTGKTTVANALAPKLGAVVLNKDSVRAALFPPGTVEYSVEQDDLCFDVMLKVAAFLLKRNPSRPVILDGRTFTQRQQVSSVIQAAQATKAPLAFIECTCAEKVALRRLAQAGSQQAHPAANRDGMLYRRLKATADPISLPHLTVATEAPLAFIVQQCLAYLADRQCEGPEAPDPPRIPGLVALAQHYQRELREIADQEHSDTNPDDPLIVRISHKLQTEADAIADLCHSEGTVPESLPIRSRRVFKWLRFLSDPTNLALHLSALAHIYKGARR